MSKSGNWPLIAYVSLVSPHGFDIVKEVFEQQASLYSNINFVANFIDWDSEGNMKGIIGTEYLHTYNKGHIAGSQNYKNVVQDRPNVILLGDNESDDCTLRVLGNVKTALKIGFLNDRVNELRKKFEQRYDIVIVDAESMALVGVLLMKLLDKK